MKKKLVLVVAVMVSLALVSGTVYGEEVTVNSGEIGVSAISSGKVSASKSGSKLSYSGVFRFSSSGNTIKVTIQNLKYVNGAYKASGSPVTKNYSNRTSVSFSGSFSVSSSSTYKVKVSVTEKKGSNTYKKTYYSNAV